MTRSARLLGKSRVLYICTNSDCENRNISGKKHAEMKWTNPDRLVDSYGVTLVGWPPSIPYQNPSTMKVGQKKELIALFDSGAMRFVKINPGHETVNASGNDDYSWALQFTNEEQTVVSEQCSCREAAAHIF